jgi:hypothetical protein
MNNPVKDIDNLIDSLTSLKRAINKFNRNSDVVKIDTAFGVNGCLYICLENTTKTDFKKLTNEDGDYILYSDYIFNPYYTKKDKCITITYEYINDTSIDDLILLLNKIFECLNHDVPNKSEIEDHCGLASELVSEWPQ